MSFDVAAEAYDRFMGRYSIQLAPQMAELAGVHAGQRALDVGCGPGALTAELVVRLGAAAVVAVDPSEPFVAAARARHPGVDVSQASAEDLPFADRAFDASLAQLVVHFMADPVAGLTEMSRVTRRDGVVAACVWDHAGGKGPLGLFWHAARALDPDVRDESQLAGAREGHLAELFEAAGLRQIDSTLLSADLEHASFDEWWDPFTQGRRPRRRLRGRPRRRPSGGTARTVPEPHPRRTVRDHGSGLGRPRRHLASGKRGRPRPTTQSTSAKTSSGVERPLSC